MTLPEDQSSQANFLEIASEHVHFIWNINFSNKTLSGSAIHTLTVKKDEPKELVLDTGDLVIKGAKDTEGSSLGYNLDSKHPVMGSALRISLPSSLKSGQIIKISVEYQTTKDCTALQWLEKEATQGKTFPYLFSQCQPIYARALAPLQDTPLVKVTYSAEISSVLPVLLSAIRVSPPSDGPAHDGKVVGTDVVTYVYDQPVPVPTYLIAIAAGNVVYRPFPQYKEKAWKTGIWAEPELIESAYWEFSEDTPRFLATVEELVLPYHFGVYDLVALPPSFPYGGMENACLTFLTPTLLTGDRTLVDVVAHEISHSYFGNGVTAHQCHFWLNEGWTTYMERLLIQTLHSPAERGLSYIIGRKGLKDDLENYKDKPKYQRLVIELEKGEDPDDAYSRVPYDKGSNFLLYLERTLGGLDVFLPYARDYVKTFLGTTITTEDWKNHLYGYFKSQPDKIKALDSVDWDAWFYGEGTSLPVEPEYDTTLAQEAYDLAARWDASRTKTVSELEFKESDLKTFNSNQIVVFLERLGTHEALPSDHILKLGSLYKFESTRNAEIRHRFYQVALLDPKQDAAKKYAPEAAHWVSGRDTGLVVGRMKFCRDIFRDVYKVDHDLAVKTFNKSKQSFHPIARKLLAKDLHID